jgi:hypothetical protein
MKDDKSKANRDNDLTAIDKLIEEITVDAYGGIESLRGSTWT